MNLILIGSRALAIRAPQILNRQPKDFDFIGYENDIINWISKNDLGEFKRDNNKIIVQKEMCEFEIIEENKSSKLFYDLVINDLLTIETEFGLVPNLNLLFTLKSTHRYLKNSPHFIKNILDYHLMKRAGAKILPEYLEFFQLREKETYTNVLPKLNVNKKEFFKNDDLLQYRFNHDDLHVAVKTFDRPAYEYYLKDGSEVMCSKEKFFSVSEEIRLAGVLEEAYTLALERSQIPFPDKITPKQSFTLALSKVCTSITSGFFREYAYENFFTVLKMYNDNYVERFWKEVEKGNVRDFEK